MRFVVPASVIVAFGFIGALLAMVGALGREAVSLRADVVTLRAIVFAPRPAVAVSVPCEPPTYHGDLPVTCQTSVFGTYATSIR